MSYDRSYVADRIGLFLIALVTLGYVIFASSFAELHILVPGFPAPVFVGEMLMVLGAILLAWKVRCQGLDLRWITMVWVLFASFIFGKLVQGYFLWGPFALRDSALFYYVFFALFGYCFWQDKGWDPWVRRGAFSVLLLLLLFNAFYYFWPFTLIVLALILARQEEDPLVRILFIGAVLFLSPYEALFPGVRTVVMASMASIIFLFFGVLIAAPHKKYTSFVWGAMILIAVVVFCVKMPSSEFWRTMDFGRIAQNMPSAVSQDPKPDQAKELRLYNPDGTVVGTTDRLGAFLNECSKVVADVARMPAGPEKIAVGQARVHEPSEMIPAGQIRTPESSEKIPAGQIRASESSEKIAAGPFLGRNGPGRSGDMTSSEKVLSTTAAERHDPGILQQSSSSVESMKIDNARFRLYIWQDMWAEMLARRPVVGFPFGHPLRSPNLEKARVAEGEWQRDGWIGAHNSFFYIIYKSGLIGIIFTTLIFGFWVRMVVVAVAGKSLTLLLLCAVLLNWIVSANFFLILELPYTAIPFWTLFGITVKQCSIMKRLRAGGPA